MGAPIIWAGDTAKLLKSTLDFNGQAQILSGTVDPSSSATSAPKGSLYLNTSNGNLYLKADAGSSTNWAVLPTSYGGTTTPASYTPTFNGFGTPTNVEFYWWQTAPKVYNIQGTFTTGTATSSEARISIPNSATSATQTSTIQICGVAALNVSAASYFGASVLTESGKTYLTFGLQQSSSNMLTKITGLDIGSSITVSVSATFRIA